LAQIYIKQNDLVKATFIQSQALKLYEGINKSNSGKTLQLIQDYFVLNDKLSRIELINRNSQANETMIKTQHKTIALLMVSLVTAVTFLVIIFIYYKQKNQMNNRLQLQHQVLLDQKKLIELQRTDLEGVNKLKDKLLAIIGHDLRTPIASLSTIADLFATDYITAEEVQKLMLDLTPVIKGAELTLTNLIEFAGSQIKGQNVTASNLNMFMVAEEMEETFRHQLQLKNIAFHNNFVSSQGVWADANHIKVVLRNLISNAIKFTGNDGYIRVFSSVRNDLMVLCVEDTGLGMTTEEANKLFDDNQHFTKRGTSGETGTGLGLLLCKELIILNQGKLWVETLPGKGCNFYFTLPLYYKAPEVQV
jgi:signal transduction histidine kinase